ncbi:hypothetical protein MLD38_006780 [Melastoma candidum]|uniref:Uncharacterized protein n=1 Tax=Melastoma candidum TaxID=119954 RepID=A0ACB9RNP6_9MYRT|nr:hypothetical protein MLD38_006780 [Melastoma candidum]
MDLPWLENDGDAVGKEQELVVLLAEVTSPKFLVLPKISETLGFSWGRGCPLNVGELLPEGNHKAHPMNRFARKPYHFENIQGCDGHYAVCKIAQSQQSKPASDAVVRLLPRHIGIQRREFLTSQMATSSIVKD